MERETPHHRRRDLFNEGPRSHKDERPSLSLYRKLLLWSALALTLFIGLVALSRLDAIQISGVEVHGAKLLSKEAVAMRVKTLLDGSYLALFPKRNMFLYPAESLRADLLAAFPRLEAVSVSRDASRTVVVELTERETHYLLCTGEHFSAPCYAVDRSGYLFDSAPQISGEVLPVFADDALMYATSSPIGMHFLRQSELERLVAIHKELLETLRTRKLVFAALGIRRTKEGDFELELGGSRNPRILFDDGAAHELGTKLGLVLSSDGFQKKLATLGQEALERIDLRFGKKVYYAFSSAATSTVSR